MRISAKRTIFITVYLVICVIVILQLLRVFKTKVTKDTAVADSDHSWNEILRNVFQTGHVDAHDQTGEIISTARIPNWMDLEQFRQDVERLNSAGFIQNKEKFKFSLKSDTVVFLVQVHNRPDTFKMQLDSMKANRFINESLLVLSHDYYTKSIFELVRTIDFCPVMQIFYPYAIQAYYKEFPGDHPNDCPRDLTKQEARNRKCNNAEYPDQYQHYREAPHTQLKHHWLWKLSFIFDRSFLKHFEGIIFRLDDDYYLAEDTIYMIRKMHLQSKTKCKDCRMFFLGETTEYPKETYKTAPGSVKRDYWWAGNGRGMAFTRQFWKEFKACAREFCLFDDCNWDWALQHVTAKCMPDGLKILKPLASRLFHIGSCKGFHRNLSCTVEDVRKTTDQLLYDNRKYLFPEKVEIVGQFPTRPLRDVPYGGWADIRDHRLCLDMFDNKSLSTNDLRKINNIIFKNRE